MAVSDGIIWSTIVIVAFASIILLSMHKRWGTFITFLTVLVVLSTVLGMGAWLYNKNEIRPQVMSSLNGINLGMSEVDVILKKGEPDDTSDSVPGENEYSRWLLYLGYGTSYTYAYLRGPKDSMVVVDVCDVGGYGSALGLSSSSSEEDVIEKLGQPSSISLNEDGTAKLISYPQWNAAFEIDRGRVNKVCVTSREALRFGVYSGEAADTE